MTNAISRKDYLAGKVSHNDYYGQFVTPEHIKIVQNAFGADAIRKAIAEDEHLNSIPIKKWDDLVFTEKYPRANRGDFTPIIRVSKQLLIDSGESTQGQVTRAFLVCTIKAAARKLVAE